MLKRLQKKWGLSTRQFWIVFMVFGLTGTTTAILTRYITALLGVDAHTFWVWKLLLRLAMLLFGYQFILLGYGALLGQWRFFWKYEQKLLRKLGILRDKSSGLNPGSSLFIDDQFSSKAGKPGQSSPAQKHIMAIFASGTGTNAEKIIQYFKDHRPAVTIGLIVCNKPGAGVLTVAGKHGIPTLLIEKEAFFKGNAYLPALTQYKINFIVLAGFLWKLPAGLIKAYPNSIVNIHPALLPKYGGKGMYGMHVHEAVIAAGEKESGITIHYVNEHFDEGEVLFQAKCSIDTDETPDSLAQKIHLLEHRFFPEIISQMLN
ncbi:MAG: hypothetical protein RLZZ28_1252 [Bacteroidota bacterium]|jgi:formyltetrahydrofolate-dependent phosphoribosylglycinamide formyltransferase